MKKLRIILFFFFSFCLSLLAYSQCLVVVDTANLSHIECPNGGTTGGASISQSGYQNFAWHNVTNGQIYGNGPGVTSIQSLAAGLYVITASNPYNSSCPSVSYSDTFEILEASVDFQFNPTQACQGLCNVSVSSTMQVAIQNINYTYKFDNSSLYNFPNILTGQCGGSHTYEVFANGNSCGVQNIGVSQFAQMNLVTNVIDENCTQQGSATVSIAGVGASAISTYCSSSPQYSNYSTIDNVSIVGDNTMISNNTMSICDTYQDYTSQSVDVTPGNNYNLNLDFGTCNSGGFSLVDFANVFIDWNIDGDFDDFNELVAQVNPTQSPSTHIVPINVPVGAIPGQSRMRIVLQNYQYQSNNQANSCDFNSAWFGATEDYTVVVNGSVANPVTYLWSDGQTSQTASNLSAGIYTITITDANGCTANDTAIINSSNFISSSITPVLQTVCVNTLADSIVVTPSGGLASGQYSYTWLTYSSPSQASQATIITSVTDSFFIPQVNSTGLSYYYCVVTNNQGCIDTSNIVTVETITNPIITTHPQDYSICLNDNISISVQDTFYINVAANTMNPIYQWFQNTTCDTTSGIPANGPGANTSIYTPQTSSVGTTYYYCKVTIPQIVGCNFVYSNCSEIIVNPIPTATVSAFPNPACLGDDIVLNASASIPVTKYRFQYNTGFGWTDMTNPIFSNSNTAIFNNISLPTQFRVKVREYAGCPTSPWSIFINVPINTIVTPLISHN